MTIHVYKKPMCYRWTTSTAQQGYYTVDCYECIRIFYINYKCNCYYWFIHKVLAIPRMLIHSETNNILHTGNGIYIQIQLGLFTVQGLEGVACCVWAGWNLATDLGKWKKFKHDLWILCQLKCMICSICRPCFKQIYFHDNQTLCSQWEPEEFLMWFWPLANLYVSHKWNICMWKKI